MYNRYDSLIKYINNWVHLPPAETEKLTTIFSYRRVLKNELFLRVGEPLEYIGFNINGVFRYYYLDFEGKEKTKYFITENDFILSLSSFIDKSPSLYSIEALDDSEILFAPINKIYSILEGNLYWQSIYKHILEKTYVIKEKREAEFLLFDAKTRYLHFVNEYPNIHVKIKQHYIASYLGITAESLSRIRLQVDKS